MHSNEMTHAEREAAAQALSDELQKRLWVVINDPAARWPALAPHVTAYAVGNLLTEVLITLAMTDPRDVQFGLWLINQIEKRFIEQTTPETARIAH